MIITRLWRQQKGKYFCISTKDSRQRWHDEFFERGELKEVDQYLKDNHDKNLYFCPHGFTKAKRLKEFAVLPHLLWSDMDDADPRTCKFKPTIAIESSPGRYVGLWVTDKPVDDLLNKRMSQAIGGDPGGWDLTQVLRVPGTLNYKYAAMPRVRLMWNDGPSWKVKKLEEDLPDLQVSETDESDASAVFKKYAKKMEPWLKRELMARRIPKQGNRSEMMFKLACGLVETGCDEHETLLLLSSTLWNKYSGRNDENKQLRNLWDRAINKKMSSHAIDDGEHDGDQHVFLSRSLADISERDLDWVWYPYLARGEVTILQGDPEAGKSFIAQNISGCICRGERPPTHVAGIPAVKGKVAYFDIENSPETVTKKRFRWAEFDEDVQQNFYQEEHPFSVNDEAAMEAVGEALERLKPALIVFDTLATYVGKTDTNSNAESQQSFLKFRQLARRYDCAVLVLRHLTKGARDRAMYRGQGNIAFTGVARIEITAGPHPTDPDVRVLARSKGNLTRRPPALTYEIIDAGSKSERDRARFEWGEFDEKLTAEQIVSKPDDEKKGNEASKERIVARELIEMMIGEGRNQVKQIMKEAEAKSISRRTMFRVRDEMALVSQTKGFGENKKTVWKLP